MSYALVMANSLLTGQCLCGQIAFEIVGGIGPVFHCHCSKCRRWHGAAFRTRTSIRKSQLKWLRGEELLRFYRSSANVTKSFCGVCGSPFLSSYEDRPKIFGLPIGALDQDPGRRPEGHIFVGSKSPWYEITDDLPQYDAWPGEEERVRETMA